MFHDDVYEHATLPDFQSVPDALRTVIADAHKTFEDEVYYPDGNNWHQPQVDGSCAVCTGGAFIACRYLPHHTVSIQPLHFPKRTRTFLEGIDHIRLGDVYDGLVRIAGAISERQPDTDADDADTLYEEAYEHFGDRLGACSDFADRTQFDEHARLVLELADWLDARQETNP